MRKRKAAHLVRSQERRVEHGFAPALESRVVATGSSDEEEEGGEASKNRTYDFSIIRKDHPVSMEQDDQE